MFECESLGRLRVIPTGNALKYYYSFCVCYLVFKMYFFPRVVIIGELPWLFLDNFQPFIRDGDGSEMFVFKKMPNKFCYE